MKALNLISFLPNFVPFYILFRYLLQEFILIRFSFEAKGG